MRDPTENGGRSAPGFIIAAGGTGGHLFPGIAIARELERRAANARIRFVVGRREMESEILLRYGYETVSVNVEGIQGKGWRGVLSALFKLPGSVFQSTAMIRAFSPLVVVGMGSYAAGPVCLSARLLGVPTAIHEQNSYPGLANRLLCRIVNRVFISFEESRKYFKGGDRIWTGNPVREELMSPVPRAPGPHGGFTILVLGGSQGAKAVNDAVTAALARPEMKKRRPTVIHQTGAADLQRVRDAYRAEGIEAETEAFIQDMARAYGRADLVVSRAGATTLSELAVLGKPSVLIPYPYAANQHQNANALSLVRGGGAEIILQSDLDGRSLALVLMNYMDHPEALAAMGEKVKTLGRPDAAALIVDHLLEMVG